MLTDGLAFIESSRLSRTAENSGSVLPSVVGASDKQLFEVIGSVVIPNGVYIFNAQLNKWVLAENTEFDVYDIGLTIFDRPKSLDIVCKHIAARTFQIGANFANSLAVATTAATATSQFLVERVVGGVATQVGTLTFAAGATTGVFASVGGTSIVFERGQVFRMKSPEIRDATLANIDITICGNLVVPR